MAAAAHERNGSRRKSGPLAYEFLYYVNGTTDEVEAENAALAASPSTYRGLVNQGVTDFEVIVSGLYFATVGYGQLDFGDADQTQFFEFDTTGGTQHITHSKDTVHWYAASDPGTTDSNDAPDHKFAIGVDSDGKNPAGVDIIAGKFDFTIKRKIANGDIDSSYLAAVYRLSKGKYNDSSFTVTIDSGVTLTFAAGECLFLGARGGPVSATQWEIQFGFSGSPNESGGSGGSIDIGDMTGIAKNGWDYLWVQFQAEEDTTAKALACTPKAAYVERVYDPDDFDDLEIA